MTAPTAIRILPPPLANRIAAGEVVERPASVVKELMENSLDAGAKRVRALIKGGGIDLIEVGDDGGGIPKEEMALAFRRHATSKLASDNLQKIETLGFRGEALAAIASVSETEMVSTHKGRGWRLRADEQEPSPAPALGTKITVRGLFRRFPARLKFLKSAGAEYAAVHEVFVKLAMAHPEVEMSLQADGRKPLQFTAAEEQNAEKAPNLEKKRRAAALLGREFADIAIPILAEDDNLTISGWLAPPTYHRRNGILSFVNGRSVRDKTLISALKDGYGDTVTAGKMPAVALFLECPTGQVDVNVHPAKTEVRFRDSRRLYGFIVRSTRDALTAVPLRPTAEKFTARRVAPVTGDLHRGSSDPQPTLRSPSPPPYHDRRSSGVAAYLPASAQTPPKDEAEQKEDGRSEWRILGQAYSKYVIAESPEAGLVIIDQHAAHERIIYEALKKGLESKPPSRQVLLTPQIVELDPDSCRRLLENAEHLGKLGLILEEFGQSAVAVREIPILLKNVDWQKLLNEIADSCGGQRPYKKRLEAACSSIACHGAIRGHFRLEAAEIKRLLELMETTPYAAQCNHGRPTIISLTEAELDKLFERS